MLLIILTTIFVALLTYLSIKPLIDNLFYSVPNESKYIHSYIPVIGFGIQMFKDPMGFIRSLYLRHGKIFTIYLQSKRWVYFYDEQAYLTKVLKSPYLTFDEFSIDFTVDCFDVSRQCVTNQEVQKLLLKQYHQYLVGDELEILNKRVHDSLLESIKNNAKNLENNPNKIINFFHFFGEFMLYAGCDGLYGESFTNEQRYRTPNFYKLFQDFDLACKYGAFRMPFRKFIYRSTYENRLRFVQRFQSLKLNNGESKLVHARDELYRSDAYGHLFNEYDVAALHASLLWAAVANTAPMSCWSVIDLLLHPEALEAVKQELNEYVSSTELIYKKETLGKLKVLESCINETIRRIIHINSVRQAMENTTIKCSDDTTLGVRKGDLIVFPTYLKHYDPNFFGPNPSAYHYDRFVRKPDQPKAPSTMIFGCGTHMCPGRYWAINEIKILVALIIQHMDLEFINMSEEDRNEYRNKLPYDYSKFVSSGGPKNGYEHKFDIKYSYKNLDLI